MKTLKIDFGNFAELRSLMDKAEEFDTILMGENEDGESVTTSILKDKIITETLQNNGWTRKNIIYYDGSREELYSKNKEF